MPLGEGLDGSWIPGPSLASMEAGGHATLLRQENHDIYVAKRVLSVPKPRIQVCTHYKESILSVTGPAHCGFSHANAAKCTVLAQSIRETEGARHNIECSQSHPATLFGGPRTPMTLMRYWLSVRRGRWCGRGGLRPSHRAQPSRVFKLRPEDDLTRPHATIEDVVVLGGASWLRPKRAEVGSE